MPIAREFTINLEDRPGMLGRVCQALAQQNINILAFHSCPIEKGRSAVRLVLDNPASAKTALDRQRADCREKDVATVTLTNRPGELALAATRLGDAGINIDYGYCGADPKSNANILILEVEDAGKAVKLLEKAAATGTSS